MDKSSPPPLLPILRSQQQAEILAFILGDAELELSVSDLAARLGIPYASVHREVERAERVGLIASRRVGRSRLIRANTKSPYYDGLSDILSKAFGAPRVLASVLREIKGITDAYIYGSWAARYEGIDGARPVGDIDVLVLGDPDRDTLYAAIDDLQIRLGRSIDITIRERDWLKIGTGHFHATVISRPLVSVPVNPPG